MTSPISVLGSMRLKGALVLDDNTTEFPLNPSIGTLVIKDQALYAYIRIGGVSNWFPLVKAPEAYTHVQSAPALQWLVEHNLSASNVWYQIQDADGQLTTPSDIEFLDNNTVRLTFMEAVQGKVLVLASGIDGEQGLEGDSAYDVAVRNGFVGTEAQWLESLRAAVEMPAAGIPVSTGTAWGASKVAPAGALVGDTDVQSLANKTIIGLKEKHVALDGNSVDLSLGNYFSKTVTGAMTLSVTNVPVVDTVASFVLELQNAGAHAITWMSGVQWAAKTAPTLTAAGKDAVAFITRDAGASWIGLVLGKDIG